MRPRSRTLPRAVISAKALRESAGRALAFGGTCADLRGDAYGHGVAPVARVLADLGVQTVLVDDAAAVAECEHVGLQAQTAGEPDVDTAALYGLDGAAQPPMQLVGRVLSTKLLRAGEGVSYGYTHRASQATTVALVTGGYAQGIVRALGNHASAEIGGRLCPIVGRVAMDVCVVDVSEPVDAGDAVTYFGGTGLAKHNLLQWEQTTGFRPTELVAVVGAKAVREWTR